jgi:putative FmdB family regulatory protein
MPVYEYRCKKCGHTFEKLVFHEKEVSRCPQCEGRVVRILSPFSVEIPDELCGRLPRGEQREMCTECRQGGGACPGAA